MRPRASGPGRGLVGTFAVALGLLAGWALVADGRAATSASTGRIPAFSRLYRTSCSTCHLAFPKLNALGEAFRLNGYRFPENDRLLRREEPVPMGAEPWKQEWPRSIWPGELPAVPPLSLRLTNDLQWTADDSEPFDWTYRFPAEVHLPAGGSLGELVGFFAELHWTPEEEIELAQAKIQLRDPLPFLPERSLHVRIGKLYPVLLAFADAQIDRAARQPLLWQGFSPEELEVDASGMRGAGSAGDGFALADAQPAIELGGLLGRRLLWGVGIAQGTPEGAADDNDSKDVYYKLRYKLGGLALDGSYDEGGEPDFGAGGQLFDRGVVLEHFGYRGTRFATPGSDHRAFGAAVEWLAGGLDLGAGAVWGEHDDPFRSARLPGVSWWSAFARAEWFAWPWLMASLKVETLRPDLDDAARPEHALRPPARSRVLPGVVALVRHNVRVALEAEAWTEHEPSDASGLDAPHNLWLRLDVAF